MFGLLAQHAHAHGTLFPAGIEPEHGLLFGLVIYVLTLFPLYVVAKRTNTPDPWLTFVPLIQIVIPFQIARVSLWWLLLVLFLPGLGYLIVSGMVWMGMFERRKKEPLLGLLGLIPVLHLFLLVYLAVSD